MVSQDFYIRFKNKKDRSLTVNFSYALAADHLVYKVLYVFTFFATSTGWNKFKETLRVNDSRLCATKWRII